MQLYLYVYHKYVYVPVCLSKICVCICMYDVCVRGLISVTISHSRCIRVCIMYTRTTIHAGDVQSFDMTCMYKCTHITHTYARICKYTYVRMHILVTRESVMSHI